MNILKTVQNFITNGKKGEILLLKENFTSDLSKAQQMEIYKSEALFVEVGTDTIYPVNMYRSLGKCVLDRLGVRNQEVEAKLWRELKNGDSSELFNL